MITAQAPGKMILIGEYAVLHGARALVCAMDCYASVNISAGDRNLFEITAPSLSIPSIPFGIKTDGQLQFDISVNSDTMKRLHFFKIVFEEINQIVRLKGNQLKPAKIEIITDDFYSADRKNKYGFGSSAAMTVALIEALLTSVNLRDFYNMQDFMRLAFRVHRRAQGNLGSGIDIAASVYGKVLIYQLKTEPGGPAGYGKPVKRWDEMYFIPIWAGHSTSTRKMVRSVDTLKESSPKVFDKIMTDLMHCSENGCNSYAQKDQLTFFDCIRDFNKILSELGIQSNTPIVSEAHRKLIEVISGTDAVYKPSGAGGGDIGIAFCDSPDAVKRIKQILSKTNYQVLNLGVADKGVSVFKRTK